MLAKKLSEGYCSLERGRSSRSKGRDCGEEQGSFLMDRFGDRSPGGDQGHQQGRRESQTFMIMNQARMN